MKSLPGMPIHPMYPPIPPVAECLDCRPVIEIQKVSFSLEILQVILKEIIKQHQQNQGVFLFAWLFVA